MFRRPSSAAAAVIVALGFVPAAAGARVHVRVEGRTQTIFGAAEPLVEAGSALQALEAASLAGEFYYHVTTLSFGPYVDQVGRYAGAGTTGWVYKVNGSSPPVGADQATVQDGDRVLWYFAQFGVAGGPKTLRLARAARPNCYRVTAHNDSGAPTPAAGALLRVGSRRTVSTRAGAACVGPHRGLLVRATLEGAVRSNALP